jgi:predicted peptidase
MDMLQRKNQRCLVTIILTTIILLAIVLLSAGIYFTSFAETTSHAKITPTAKIISPTPTSTPISNFGYIAHTFTNAKGQSLPYYLYIPAHYDPQQKYPLVLMLEGSGEASNLKRTPEQNREIFFHASYIQVWSAQYRGHYNPDIQQRWPCFVVVPQLTTPQQWVNVNDSKGSYKQPMQTSTQLLLTKELLDALQQEYSGIDANRLYITGLSLGGYGTWDAIERWPNYFAAAAPIAGAGDPSPSKAALLVHLPIWDFHGSKDPHVPVSGSRDMIKAIRAAGGHPRYTEFAGAGHGVWGRAYGTDAGYVPDFLPWLFSQHRA